MLPVYLLDFGMSEARASFALGILVAGNVAFAVRAGETYPVCANTL